MKAYTDIEQSKKLAEILPLESADMYYPNRIDMEYQSALPIEFKLGNPLLSQEIPCWSLAALLEVIGVECRMEKTPLDQSGEFTYLFVDDYYNIRTFEEDNAVDAAIEMIYKLKEKDLL